MLGLFSGRLIFGGAYYRNEFRASKLVGFDDKNILWAYIREGLLSGGYLRLRFGGTYMRERFLFRVLIIGILRYAVVQGIVHQLSTEESLPRIACRTLDQRAEASCYYHHLN